MLQMTDQYCTIGDGQQLCYRSHGMGTPIILIAGLGLQLTYWHENLIQNLVSQDFQVITFDNRDIGRSFYLDDIPPISRADLILRRRRKDNYDLTDMAHDTVGLMTALGIERAHIAGISMGGMIAQNIAAISPEKVLSLTSIFSTTGNMRIGQPNLKMMQKLLRPAAENREEYLDVMMDVFDYIGGRGIPDSKDWLSAYFSEAWERAGMDGVHGQSRQVSAIMNSGDRSEMIKKIKAPTLVLHGDRDPLIHPNGGRATANLIEGASFKTIEGMGHHISEGAIPHILQHLSPHLKKASEI